MLRETVPCRQYRSRHRKLLSVSEQEKIVDEYVSKYFSQKEIARRFRVTVQLVRDLVKESRKKPEKLRLAKEQEKKMTEKRYAIKDAINSVKEESQAIYSTEVVKTRVKEKDGIEVSAKLVRQVLKTDYKHSFVRAKKLNPNANTDRSLVLRQQYALSMM